MARWPRKTTGRRRYAFTRKGYRPRYRATRRARTIRRGPRGVTYAKMQRAIMRHHEVKQATVADTELQASTTPVWAHITNLGVGDGHDNRDGDKITLKGVAVKGRAAIFPTSDSEQTIRIVAVQIFNHDDELYRHDTLAWEAFFYGAVDDVTSTKPFLAWHTKKRFAILGAKTFKFKAYDENNPEYKDFSMYIKPKRKTLLYDTEGTSSWPDNAVWLMVYGTNPYGTTAGLFTVKWRSKFFG